MPSMLLTPVSTPHGTMTLERSMTDHSVASYEISLRQHEIGSAMFHFSPTEGISVARECGWGLSDPTAEGGRALMTTAMTLIMADLIAMGMAEASTVIEETNRASRRLATRLGWIPSTTTPNVWTWTRPGAPR